MIAVVAIAAVAVLLLRGGPDLEIRLEPVALATPDSFTPTVASEETRPPEGLALPEITRTALPPAPERVAPAAVTDEPPPPPRQVPGVLPGLFGGTRDDATCDPEQLVDFLASEPEKAAVWAGVFELQPEQIAGFVAELTPVVLTRDTRVTNHGFRDGELTRVQAVLQAGTAVMVDPRGVPRVKCGCGNPLLPPAVIDADLEVAYDGEPWEGWRPDQHVEIVVDTRVEVLVLIDLEENEPFERPVGSDGSQDRDLDRDTRCELFPDDPVCLVEEEAVGDDLEDGDTILPDPDEPELGTGDVQATLRWTSDADMDLAVIDPNGDRVYYGTRTIPSGGELDIDVIPCSRPDTPRVENIFWPEGTAPAGTYTVEVTYFSTCDDPGPQRFSLQVIADGALVLDEVSQLADSGDTQEWTFTVVGAG